MLIGSNAKNILYGGLGDDTLYGSSGDDVFGFYRGYDNDVIGDFESGTESADVIRLIGFGFAYNSFNKVMAVGSQVGANAYFDFDQGDTLTLLNTNLSSLTGDDFMFG